MIKERKYCGLTVVLDNESYSKYKGTLNEQIDEFQERIDKAIEYIEKWQSFPHTNGSTHEELRNLKSILRGEE